MAKGCSANGKGMSGKGVPPANAGARIKNTATPKGGPKKGPTRGKHTWGQPGGFPTGQLKGHKPW